MDKRYQWGIVIAAALTAALTAEKHAAEEKLAAQEEKHAATLAAALAAALATANEKHAAELEKKDLHCQIEILKYQRQSTVALANHSAVLADLDS